MKKISKFILPKLVPLPSSVHSWDIPGRHTDLSLGKEFIEIHRGPSKESNWLIPNHILMSGYPFNQDVDKGILKLTRIIDSGVNVIVNLQTRQELKYFEPYEKSAMKIFKKKNEKMKENEKKKLYFLSCEIEDNDVPEIEETRKIVKKIIEHMKNGDIVLVHCHGGHGRTGLISCCLIGELYKDLKFTEILRRVQACHDCRVARRNHSPQTYPQFVQVAKYLGKKRIDERILGIEKEEIE